MKELTLKDMTKLYKQAQKYADLNESFLVSKKIVKKIDGFWIKLPWYEKLFINMKRLINGIGLYKKLSK